MYNIVRVACVRCACVRVCVSCVRTYVRAHVRACVREKDLQLLKQQD